MNVSLSFKNLPNHHCKAELEISSRNLKSLKSKSVTSTLRQTWSKPVIENCKVTRNVQTLAEHIKMLHSTLQLPPHFGPIPEMRPKWHDIWCAYNIFACLHARTTGFKNNIPPHRSYNMIQNFGNCCTHNYHDFMCKRHPEWAPFIFIQWMIPQCCW